MSLQLATASSLLSPGTFTDEMLASEIATLLLPTSQPSVRTGWTPTPERGGHSRLPCREMAGFVFLPRPRLEQLSQQAVLLGLPNMAEKGAEGSEQTEGKEATFRAVAAGKKQSTQRN